MAIQNTLFFVEIMYNDNDNSYTSNNSNSNSKVDNIRITHNSNRRYINRIVRMSSNQSINA